MARKPRKPRPKKINVPKGYDSLWEYGVHQDILGDWKHHWQTIEYVVQHNYEADFVRTFNGKTILLEAKGRFWDYAEFSKYIWIQKALPSTMELVFLFADPSAPMPQAKRRKDGTKRSHGEWASDNGFRWFTAHSLPDEWRSD